MSTYPVQQLDSIIILEKFTISIAFHLSRLHYKFRFMCPKKRLGVKLQIITLLHETIVVMA
jgi:hypothetical protein